MFFSIVLPTFPGVLEAPITATDEGLKRDSSFVRLLLDYLFITKSIKRIFKTVVQDVKLYIY